MLRLLASTLLCLLLGVHGYTELPLSGFVRVATEDSGLVMVLRLSKRVRGRPMCSVARLTNAPVGSAQSPLMGSSLFKLVTESSSSSSSSSSRVTVGNSGDADVNISLCADIKYYNGRPAWTNGKEVISFVPSNGKGTWILGTEPGVDSGYAYLKPSADSLFPHRGTADQWHWLINNEWLPRDDVSFECTSTQGSEGECAAVDSADTHFYVVERFDGREFSESYYLPQAALLWDQDSVKWVKVGAVEIIAAFGEPLRLFVDPRSGQPSASDSSFLAHIVNQEQGSGGFRVILRRNDNSFTEQHQLDEYTVELGPSSPPPFSRLPSSDIAEHAASVQRSLAAARPGDWLWLWHGGDGSGDEQVVADVLLQCVEHFASTSVAVFRYFDSDRASTMHRTVLSRETQFYSLKLLPNSSSSPTPSYSLLNAESAAVAVMAVFSRPTFGPDIVSFLAKHLAQKEGTLGDLPSCFLYHAAVSMPAQLVYAAELLCVLLAAKPVAMVQYSSSTDHQWKFPLVSEITSAIARLKIALPEDALPVDYIVMKYQSDETLILFQKAHRELAESLQPFGAAQALHPLPYPDAAHLNRDEKLQIYHAWWNGFVLGYPEHFIDSYCLSFHNDLSESERREQMARARVDVAAHLRSRGLPRPSIGRSDNSGQPVDDDELWRRLRNL